MAENTEDCIGVVGPNFGLDSAGNPVDARNVPGCVENDFPCKTGFDLTGSKDSEMIDRYVAESLNIAGAVVNVYRMLGIHEQGKLVDVIGYGTSLANGSQVGFPSDNAFSAYNNEWRSLQRGDGVIASSYIGYDFGDIMTTDGSRPSYGVDTSIRKHITAFAIKQSANQNNRVTKVRLERSDDGVNWKGVSVVILPDDDCLNIVLSRSSVPSRFWRIKALEFNGSADDYWAVVALEMFHDYIATDIDNIQDQILLENRDRDYDSSSIEIRGAYDLIDTTTNMSRFGIEMPVQMLYLMVNFSACVAVLGRPLVIGDIVEIPSEAQYSAKMEKIQKWMEVTDVAWSTEGYTPGWKPTLQRIILKPAIYSQETQDIFGDLADNEGTDTNYQNYFDASDTIEAAQKDKVPERGDDSNNGIRQFEEDELNAAGPHAEAVAKVGLAPTSLYVEDGMPPNNAPYTEGNEFPENPTHGDYHRLTYTHLTNDYYPPRLHRYSDAKGRWVYLETDRRQQFNAAKPKLQEFITSPNSTPSTKLVNNKEND